MLRLVGLWTEPSDVDAFEREYLGAHVPNLHHLVSSREVRTARCLDGPFFRLTEGCSRVSTTSTLRWATRWDDRS
jgi:hypothetical protein